MALIRHRKLAADSWKRLETAEGGVAFALAPGVNAIVPLAVWRTHREQLLARLGGRGVWLGPEDDPAEIAGDLEHLAVIAVRFPTFTDGRGYSIGRLLRERYGWRRELRAIGDIQRDQLAYLARCGFDAFELRDGEDAEAALAAFNDFSDAYQASAEQPLPLFRRRETAGSRL